MTSPVIRLYIPSIDLLTLKLINEIYWHAISEYLPSLIGINTFPDFRYEFHSTDETSDIKNCIMVMSYNMSHAKVFEITCLGVISEYLPSLNK